MTRILVIVIIITVTGIICKLSVNTIVLNYIYHYCFNCFHIYHPLSKRRDCSEQSHKFLNLQFVLLEKSNHLSTQFIRERIIKENKCRHLWLFVKLVHSLFVDPTTFHLSLCKDFWMDVRERWRYFPLVALFIILKVFRREARRRRKTVYRDWTEKSGGRRSAVGYSL